MSNKRFFIKNLGEFEYLVTLLSVDYPETFVARKIGEECDIYIFDEIKNDENSITWICSAITIDELDGLNKGIRTLNSCFYGPRKTKKQGYLVTSSANKEEADCLLIDDTSKYVAERDVYVPQFVEDNHGSSVLSLATGKVLFSLVLDDKKNADPFFDIRRLTTSTNDGKAFLQSLPYNISVKDNKACIQSNQSIVINFEISDKPIKLANSKQLTIEQIDESIDNVESLAALNAIEKAFNSGDDKEKLISALGNNKNAIKKYHKFVSTISKNKNEKQLIQTIKPNFAKSNSIELNKKSLQELSNQASKSIELMNSQSKKTSTIIKAGYFEMFDIKGKGRFRFIADDKTIYRGTKSNVFDINKCPIEMQDSESKYIIEMNSLSYAIDGKETELSYELVSVKKEPKPLQGKLEI